ncbi:MAG: DUF1285 domain-containing protein [Robiginitomaculum sp.]|nr:DUF1285 domain-containing protein [Robiginitomaculum sp.]
MALKTGKTGLAELIALARKHGQGMPPVDKWNPEYCGEMDMVIRRDGSWWHEGGQITRAPLIKLFASVLRKDNDGETYLVTPVEKIRIEVECAAFLAVRVDVQDEGKNQRLFFTTNMDEVVELGAEHALNVHTDSDTLEPTPLIHIRGRLEALLLRPVFYELVALAVERETKEGTQLGVYSGGVFFPLGPAGIHDV